MIIRRALVAMALVAGGCGPSAVRPEAVPTAPGPPSVTATDDGLDAATILADRVAAAEKAGAERFVALGAEALDEGGQVGRFVTRPAAGACLLGVAGAGDSAQDVDVFAYADDGTRLASDESPGPRAAVLLCPPYPDRVYLVARNVTGAGVVGLAVMQVPTERADAVARGLEVRGRPGEDSGRLAAWPGLERRLRERQERLGAGWEDVRRVAIPVHPAAAATVSARIDAGRCLDVLAVPDDDVPAVDLSVLAEDGRIVARGRSPGRDRATVVCSSVGQTVTVAVRPRAAAGLVAVVIRRSAPGAIDELDADVGLNAVTPLGPLASSLARLKARRLSRAGWGASEELARSIVVPTRGMTRVPLTLRAGCSRYDVVGGAPLGGFTATLWRRDDGVRLAVGRGGEVATGFACAAATTTAAELELAAVDRPGPAAVLLRRIDDVPPALTASPRAAGRLLGRFEGLQREPITPRDLEELGGQRVEVGQRAVRRVALGAAQCVDVVAAVDGAPQPLSLRLEDAAGSVRAATTGFGVASVHHCRGEDDDDGARLALQLEVRRAPTVVLSAVRRR
ncbi:MAG: hypothetical protein AAGN82_28415 [Myxococcota bacterium]